MIEDVGLFDVIECAVPQCHIVNRCVVETTQLQREFAFATSDVLKMNVADIGAFGSRGAFFISKVDLQDRGTDFTDPYIAEVNVLDRPAAHGIGLQAQRLI